jgi:hypothetical protein
LQPARSVPTEAAASRMSRRPQFLSRALPIRIAATSSIGAGLARCTNHARSGQHARQASTSSAIPMPKRLSARAEIAQSILFWPVRAKFPAPCCRLDLVSNQEDVGFIFRQSQHSIQKLQPMRRFRPRSANMHLRPDTGLLIAIPANDANTDNESDGVERAYVRVPRWINRRRPSVERARSFREPEPMNSPLRRQRSPTMLPSFSTIC